MRDRLPLGWWWLSFAWCIWNVICTYTDIRYHEWVSLCIDGPLAVLFFFAAHLSWEEEYYQ
jgi:hypothetical protein